MEREHTVSHCICDCWLKKPVVAETETEFHEMFLQSRPGQQGDRGQSIESTGGWCWSLLMTLPVKVCRAASATVIRGPPSHRGRGPTLLPLGLFRKKKVIPIQRNCQNIQKSAHLTFGQRGHLSVYNNCISDENLHYQQRFSHRE